MYIQLYWKVGNVRVSREVKASGTDWFGETGAEGFSDDQFATGAAGEEGADSPPGHGCGSGLGSDDGAAC
ncbi:hypothetical protein D3C77_738220 [compost metagenome]